jgi:hypothetical protein
MHKHSANDNAIIKLHYPQGGTAACVPFIKVNPQIIVKGAKVLGVKFTGTRRNGKRLCQVPQHANPLVKKLFQHMRDETYSITVIALRSGVERSAISKWHRRNPSLGNFEAVCNAAGLELVLREIRI